MTDKNKIELQNETHVDMEFQVMFKNSKIQHDGWSESKWDNKWTIFPKNYIMEIPKEPIIGIRFIEKGDRDL